MISFNSKPYRQLSSAITFAATPALKRFAKLNALVSPNVRRRDFETDDAFEAACAEALRISEATKARLADGTFSWTIPNSEALDFGAIAEAYGMRVRYSEYDKARATVRVHLASKAEATSKKIDKALANNVAAAYALDRARKASEIPAPVSTVEVINETASTQEVKTA